MLTPDQRRSLYEVAMSERTQPRIARRARLVLDADAEEDTVSRTARKWFERYLAHGLTGLTDSDRPGRPATIAADAVNRVLVEPLFTPVPKWTSRTVAAATGVSQSTVVRTWEKVFDPQRLRDHGPWANLDHRCRPTGLLLSSQATILVLACTPSPRSAERVRLQESGLPAFSMRSPIRRPLQTILAAELITGEGGDTDTASFLDAAMPDAERDYVIVCRSPLTDEVARAGSRDNVDVVTVPADSWQALLPHLGAAVDTGALPVLTELSRMLRQWTQHPNAAFCWPRPDDAASSTMRRGTAETPAPATPSPSQRLAESVAAAIQLNVHSGRLRGGERITESFLTRATHASRGQVRDALKSLASDGLVDLQPGRGAIVPTPTVHDVLETYSVRRSLGVLIVTSAADWRPGALAPVLEVLDELRTVAQRRDTWATGESDLDFQDALAATTSLRRVPAMFRRMTIQLRLFISVMGLNYAYSIDDIVTDDHAIFDAIKQRNAATARSRWEQKMDAAVTYMVRQRDSGTWSRR